MSEMTPKQRYEARKAERDRRRQAKETLGHEQKDILMEEMFGRFITAVERIADALESAGPSKGDAA